MKTLASIALATFIGLPLAAAAEPTRLASYPDDALEQIDFLTRCAGLSRALQRGGIDREHYVPHVGADFNAKLSEFERALRPLVMTYFGFDPSDLKIMDEGRNQLPHVRIVSYGVEETIKAKQGFYETMSQFREKPEWDAIVIEDLATCGEAPI